VKGGGNSTGTLNYSYVDNSPYIGNSYYRLSQTDFDGHTENIGSMLFTSCSGSNATLINAYSAVNFIDVQVNSVETANSNYTITLCNTLGQTMLNETHTIVPGSNEFKLYTNVPTGVYFLTVGNNTNIYHKKIFLKQ
jgi:hypothetical protein